MATFFISSKLKTTPTSPSGQNEGFQDTVADQENARFRNNDEHIIEGHIAKRISCGSCNTPSLTFARKVVAEIIGTFFVIFLGCGAVVVDKKSNGSITHLGISLVWGMVVMLIIYALGHISGAHLNPSVTIAFAVVGRFPWAQVPAYIGAQVFATISAGFALRLLFGEVAHMAATIPAGSDMQSFVLELLITFLLLFVVSALADTRAKIGDLGGLAVGTTVALNVIVAGPISGASMNPARTIGSAVSGNKYTSIWLYMVAPVLGAIAGAVSYNSIRLTD